MNRATAFLFAGGLAACGVPARASSPSVPPCDDAASCGAILRATPEVDGARVGQEDYAARRIADFGAEGRAVIRDLLRSPIRKERWLGAIAAVNVPRDGVEDIVPALVDAFRASPNELHMLRAFAGLQDPRVLDVLTEVLPRSGFAPSILRTLDELGAYAAPALPLLRQMATTHWDGDVRAAAAETFRVVGGTALEPAPFRCPVAVDRDPPGMDGRGTWRVTLHDSVVRLQSLEDDLPPRTAVCLSRNDDPGPNDAFAIFDDEIGLRYESECNGPLSGWHASERRRFGGGPSGPLRLHDGDVLTFGALGSLPPRFGGGAWSVYAVSNGDRPEGVARLVARASGLLLGYAVDASGVDLLVVQLGTSPMGHVRVPSCSTATRVDWKRLASDPFRADDDEALVLLHIDSDGAVTVRQ